MKRLALLMTLLIVLSAADACTEQGGQQAPASVPNAAEVAAPQDTSGAVTFPLANQIEIDWWDTTVPPAVTSMVTSYDEAPLFQKVSEIHNIKINFITPVSGGATEQFNLLVSAGEIPDIIGGNAGSYTGGKVQAYADGLIIDIRPHIETYMPNLTKIIEGNPAFHMNLFTNEGELLGVPAFRDTNYNSYGLIVRSDWMEEAGIASPTTVEEFYNLLTAFKEIDGVDYPFAQDIASIKDSASPISGAFRIPSASSASYYVDEGVVKNAAVQESTKEYIKTIAQWYAEGLIDVETVSLTGEQMDSKMTGGTAGVTLGYAGGTAGRYLTLMAGQDYTLGGIQPLKLNASDPDNSYMDPYKNPVNNGGIMCISAITPYTNEILGMLDYGYGKEGHYLYNFGIEGDSYTMENGVPTYTEKITKNPLNLSMAQILGMYAKATSSGPMIQDYRYQEAYFASSGVFHIVDEWSKSIEASRAGNHGYPATLTSEQAEAVTDKQSVINTYASEMFAKWVTGAADVEADWDSYVAEMDNKGLQDVLEVRQQAYDDYVTLWPMASQPLTTTLTDYIRANFE
jgi:putative aldouronate transport system substrate-binding protein